MRWFVVPLILLASACSDTSVTKFNSDPEVAITSHSDGDTVQEGVPENLRGQVGDPNHSIDSLSVTWLISGTEVCTESEPDDEGVVTCEVTFVPGDGEIALEVRDPEGASASTRLNVDVQPTDAPLAVIIEPSSDGVYYSDVLTTLSGTVSDNEDAISSLVVTWESGIDGVLVGAFDTPDSEGGLLGAANLSEGEHFLTLTVTDTTAKEARDSVTINVGPPNTAPTCEITNPADSAAGPEGEEVRFEGTAADVDVPSDWLAVTWTSDKQGDLGASTPDTGGGIGFAISDLSVDTHRITITVNDEVGATCTDSIYYTVGTPPSLTVTAPTDGETLNHSEAVVFEATVNDNEDPPNEVALSWNSDVDGVFSTDGADSSGEVTVSVDSLSAGDHVVTVTATDTAGLFVTDTVSFNLNEPPTAPTVTLEPDPATTNQMLVATASGSIDPEGTGTVTYAYEWFEDGVPSPESSSATYPSSATAKHHTYRVQVVASDGLMDSSYGWAEVSVINSDPVLVGPTVSPSTAATGDILTCSATATDIDPEDSPTVDYAWSDGSTGSTYTVTMSDSVDSIITCTATANDGDGGIGSGTASAMVTNTAPTVDSVTVTPPAGRVGDALSCAATASDADGETPTISYVWSSGETGSTYTITDADNPGDVLTCTATATDPGGLTATGSAFGTVSNTDPVMGTVTISPDPATNSDTLTCTATASDADGGSPSLGYTWSTGATGSTLALSSAIAASGDTLSCTATATDAHGGSATGSADITLSNRDPSVSVALSPAAPTKHDTLTCTAVGVSDPDDDTTTVAFTWTVDGTPEAASTTSDTDSTLADAFVSGQSVTCLAEVSDGKGGTSTGTATIEIVNTAPEVLTVTLTPSAAYTDDTLTAVTTTTDLDGESVTVSYAWFVDGSPVGDSGSTLSGAAFTKGQTVRVAATPSDGTDEGVVVSSDGVVIRNSVPVAPVVSIAEVTPDPVLVLGAMTYTICATDSSGETVCWGQESHGIIRDVPAGEFIALAGSADHACGLTISGSIACWGKDDFLQVSGAPGGVFVAIDSTENGNCALDADGEVGCWGRDTYFVTSGAPSGTYSAIEVGAHHACVLDEEGAITCWGSNTNGEVSETPEGTFTEISAGFYHNCALDEAGEVACWGSDGFGQVSDAPAGSYAALAGGGHHQCALDSGGAIECWGCDVHSEISDAPTGVYEQVWAGFHYNCAVDSRGDVECWGFDAYGQVSSLPSDILGEPSTLVCAIDEESTDADGDAVSYTFAWDVDGAPFSDTDTTTEAGDTIPASATSADEEWTCTVTPNDGEDDGAVAVASTVIEVISEPEYGGTMILIDAQTFEMGCTAGMSSCDSAESPAHDVTLTNDFYIGETEVTQGEYYAMMGTSPSYFGGCGDDCPVEMVSWHMSAAFANAVSDSEGLEQCYTCTGSDASTDCAIAVDPYSCGGYRLPTEAEWEAAARCGEDTLYAGSTVIGDVAWYNGNSGSTTHTVATKASNACGLYDMTGNVWEWTQDWYSSSYYSSSPDTDPGGPISGVTRVDRGGSWIWNPAAARVANRAGYGPTGRVNDFGFRLLRTSP